MGRTYRKDPNRVYKTSPEERARAAARHHANPDYVARIRLKRDFGMTLEQYDEMLAAQDGVCAICSGINPDGKRLAVDHDHGTGQVRALLCSSCNTAIGQLKDSPTLLRLAAAYLDKHPHG